MSAKDPSPRRKGHHPDYDWKPIFLDGIEAFGTTKAAAAAAGITVRAANMARQRDEEFAVAWAERLDESVQEMEREAYRRAVQGTEKPVYQGGKMVGTIREYSDALLVTMLKGHRPERYRENVKVEHGGVVKHDVAGMTDDELQALADGLDRRAGA